MNATLNGAAADTSHWPTVTLGDESYTVVPQRVGRLKKRLGRELDSLQNITLDGGLAGFVSAGLERAHSMLKVFIPDLMPVHEFCGYRSEEDMATDTINEEGKEYGPTVPQIVDAYEAVMRVNRVDLFKQLGNVISPDLIRAYINRAVAQAIAGSLDEDSPTTTSVSTSSLPGLDTPLTTSGTSEETPETLVSEG